MTTQTTKRSRGRPKLYDADQALDAATQVFWARGFEETSLDDLALAMNMNRPSIYRAFGDKASIYQQSMLRFAARMKEGFEQTVATEADLSAGLKKFYRAAIAVYTTQNKPFGCMVMCTAPVGAMTHRDTQAELHSVIGSLDEQLCHHVKQAIAKGQLPESTDPKTFAQLIQAVLHSLAIRARAGASKNALNKLADAAVHTLVG